MNRQVAKWTVGKLGSDKTPQLNGTIVLIPNSENVTEEAPPIQMHWKVPMASVSGMFSPFAIILLLAFTIRKVKNLFQDISQLSYDTSISHGTYIRVLL